MLGVDTSPQLQNALTQKHAQVEKLDKSYATVKDRHNVTQTALSNAEELLQTLLTGLSSSGTGNSGGGGYMGQLADAKAKLAQATAEEEQSRVKLGMSEKELKALEGRWKEVEREAGDGKKNLESVKAETEKFRRKVEECGWSAEKERDGEIALRTAKGEFRQFTEVNFDTSVTGLFFTDNFSRNATLSNNVFRRSISATRHHPPTSIGPKSRVWSRH